VLLAEPDRGIENLLRNLELRRLRYRDRVVRGHDRDLVAIGVEADVCATDIIEHDSIHTLLSELGASVLQQVVRFGGESDQ